MSDKDFIEGMSVKDPHENAPDFVICQGGFRREAMIAYLQSQSGDYVNFQIKRSKKGALYVEKDNWRPTEAQRPDTSTPPPQSTGGDFDDDLPF